MDFAEYEAAAVRTRVPDQPLQEQRLLAALGLTGEAGEFADQVKKSVFHGHDWDRDHVIEELGDVLWYLALAARACDTSLDDVARRNIEKLERRYPDGFSQERSRRRDR